jgi:hypothetical protein
VLCSLAETTVVTVWAQIAGTRIPVAAKTLHARPAATPAVSATERPTGTPASPDTRVPWLRLAALAQIGVDTWAHATGGGGGGLRARASHAFSFDVALRYLVTIVDAEGQGLVEDALAGLCHTAELLLGIRYKPFAAVPFELLGGAGLAFSSTRATIGANRADDAALQVPFVLGVGTTVQLGHFSLGLDAFARTSVPLQQLAWNEPWLRFGLEVSGGFDVAQ